MIAGIGVDNLRSIEVDENFAMRPDALARQIEADKRAGLVPCFVCATVGTTSSNAMDPIAEIARVCAAAQSLAARGCGHVGHGRTLPGIPPSAKRSRTGRQLQLQPAQVDVHQLRLQLLLGRRSQSADPDSKHLAGIPAQPGHGIGRGDRLSRLAHPARPPFPLAEVVVRDPPLRRGRPAAPHPPPRGTGAAIRGAGCATTRTSNSPRPPR